MSYEEQCALKSWATDTAPEYLSGMQKLWVSTKNHNSSGAPQGAWKSIFQHMWNMYSAPVICIFLI